MKKAIICTKSTCNHKYHQEVAFLHNISVHHCPQCGGAGRMIMGPGQPELIGVACNPFTPPKFRLPELSLPVNNSYLEASVKDIHALHFQATQHRFTLVGFHGCGSIAAQDILKQVRDVSTTNARGRGFMVGSLYNGIPNAWARQVKGGGVPTILRVYVRDWNSKSEGVDYDWGKMDPDDDIKDEGLEMALRPRMFNDIFTLPSLGESDQQLVGPAIWEGCPTHSFRPEEMDVVTRLASWLNISLDELEQRITEDPESIEKTATQLGIAL